jgi:toxin ParE1/3/4
MAQVKLSQFAEADLKEIWSYIAETNIASADKITDEFLKKFQLLAQNSEMGKRRDDLILNLRSFPHKRYVIFYFPIDEGIEVFRVLHGSRDITSLFDDLIDNV